MIYNQKLARRSPDETVSWLTLIVARPRPRGGGGANDPSMQGHHACDCVCAVSESPTVICL
jgi:hypothetical protein